MAIYEEVVAPFDGAIDCDETILSGRRRGKCGWGAWGKVLIFEMLKRNGVVRVFAVPNYQKATLLPLIVQPTSPGSLFYTDEYSTYASLKVQEEHIVVTKDKSVPQKFVNLYLAELSYRFNHREQDIFSLLHKEMRPTDCREIETILVRAA